MQSHSCSERVAEERSGLAAQGVCHGFGHQVCGRRKIGSHVARTAVTGQIDGDERVVVCQQVAEGTPQSPRLGESVEQREGRTRTADLDMEWHVE